MSSLTAIANKALRKLAVEEIANLSQQGATAERCNAAVEEIVKEVICQHAWRHATVFATLPLIATAPAFGYEYAYQAPVESFRVYDIRSTEDLTAPAEDFEEVRGKVIYTDASPCYARYIVYNESDLSLAYPDFINTCAYKLAAEIAPALSMSDKTQEMYNGYLMELDNARLNDASANWAKKQDENRACSMLNAFGYPNGTNLYEEV